MYEQVEQEHDSLIGENASIIAYSNLLCDSHPLIEAVLDAAISIRAEPHYLSAWRYVAQWEDGTTVWRAPDGSATATVSRDGTVHMESL